MNREQALDAAIASVLRGPVDDYRRGLIDRTKLEEMARRRKPAIAACVLELLGGAKVPDCACGAPSTTRIAGADYCEDCAAAAPRPGRPI